MAGPKADTAAWVRAALERFEQPLVRYAQRFTGDLETARDVVQDTFLKLCTADRAKVEDHLAAWLYTVCRNRALDVRKKEQRMTPFAEGQAERLADAAPAPVDTAGLREEHALVWQALDGLPGRQREAFRLKFQDDLSYREISQVMGVSLGTVANLVAAGLETVRNELRDKLDLAQEGSQ